MYKKKFNAWRTEIPTAIQMNRKYGQRIDKYIDERNEAMEEAEQAKRNVRMIQQRADHHL